MLHDGARGFMSRTACSIIDKTGQVHGDFIQRRDCSVDEQTESGQMCARACARNAIYFCAHTDAELREPILAPGAAITSKPTCETGKRPK